jgi:hypothetical protein
MITLKELRLISCSCAWHCQIADMTQTGI